MRYKTWFWVSLTVSVFLIVLTIILVVKHEREMQEYYSEYIRYVAEKQQSENEALWDDSIRRDLARQYEAIYEMRYKEIIRDLENNLPYGEVPPQLRDSLAEELREELNGELQQKLNQVRNEYSELNEINPPVKPTNDGFNKICGISSVLGLFFTFFFRYKDNQEKRKEKEEKKRQGDIIESEHTAIASVAKKVVEDLERQKNMQEQTSAKFEINPRYKGYRTELAYKNVSSVCAKNVKVTVIQDEKDKLSETVIVNSDQFPLSFVMPGDWFYVDVDCYYPKAYREFHIQWEDETGSHDEHNRVLLSKNYVV